MEKQEYYNSAGLPNLVPRVSLSQPPRAGGGERLGTAFYDVAAKQLVERLMFFSFVHRVILSSFKGQRVCINPKCKI